ncbi:hypothetical protein [Paenibacillus bouchesdurhonensis]|uniref:hypothetical protein n=1 Tax=Paenibacillus bouchesdurhonensis TaxID=1870990 RepID=UPI000DA613F8|nr:hypothetical protein [Paenibacillus bouchesdurhonensis]
MSIEFDISGLLGGLERSKNQVIKAAEVGVHDATDSLLNTSRDLAPHDKGTLRLTAGTNVEVNGDVVEGEVYYNATETDEYDARVNYALITHELHSGDGFSGIAYKDPTTPGTTPKYLERPLKQNAEEYRDMIAKAIREGLS